MESSSSAPAKKTSLLIAVIAGAAVLITGLIMMSMQPATLPWMPEGYLTPILALEFAPDMSVVRQMFADEGTAAQAMIQLLQWDMAFAASYGIFLLAVVWTLFPKGVLRYIALFFAGVAPIADVAENLQLLALLDFVLSGASFRAEPPIDFSTLRLAVVLKFGAIAIVHIRLLRVTLQMGRYGRILSAFLLGSIFATGASFYTLPYALDVAIAFTGICWVLLWIMMLPRLRQA